MIFMLKDWYLVMCVCVYADDELLARERERERERERKRGRKKEAATPRWVVAIGGRPIPISNKREWNFHLSC